MASLKERVTFRPDWPGHDNVPIVMYIPVRGLSSELREVLY